MSFATWNFANLFLKWRKQYLLGKEEEGDTGEEEETPFIKINPEPLQKIKSTGIVLAVIVLLALSSRE